MGGTVASADAQLTVNVPPQLTDAPTVRLLAVGNDFSVFVPATGTAPLAYRWQKDGTNIPGATSPTLVLTNLQVSDSGDYSAVVSNVAGTATNAVPWGVLMIPPQNLGQV